MTKEKAALPGSLQAQELQNVRMASKPSAFAYSRRLRRLEVFVDEAISNGVAPRQAAASEVVNLERHYFCAYFKKHTGVKYGEWLAGKMVGRAKELLSRSDDTVETVATECGFGSARSLRRWFKHFEGVSPSQWRRERSP